MKKKKAVKKGNEKKAEKVVAYDGIKTTAIEKFINNRKPEDIMFDLGSRHLAFDEAAAMLGISVRMAQSRKLQKYWYAGSKTADAMLKLQARGMATKSATIMKLLLEVYCGIAEGQGKIEGEDKIIPPKIVEYEAMEKGDK